MKKLICLILCMCLTVPLLGCGGGSNGPAETTGNTVGGSDSAPSPTEQTPVDQTMLAVSVPSVTEKTLADDGTVLFEYTYQHMSLVLEKPDIADKIILDFLNRVDGTREAAESTAAIAKTDYAGNENWTPYLYHITYSPTRIDHNVLSLFGNNVVYSGATHPDRTCVSASYDLQTGDVLTLASIMTADAKIDSVCDLVLDGLSEMAEGDYLYENYKQTVQHRFGVDASGDEAWYFTQTGLCFYFAPYEIAPYTSGVITVEIPYEKLTDLLHGDYLPAKRNSTEGKMTAKPFESVAMDSLINMAEIVMNRDGDMYMLQADNPVQDVRITLTDKANNYTVFAAYHLAPGNGIMIQADQAILQQMKLTYKSGNETVSANLP